MAPSSSDYRSEPGYAGRVGNARERTDDEDASATSERLCVLVHMLARDLLGRARDELAALELSEREYLTLAVLSSERPGSQHELGKLMGLAPQLVVALTDGLEDRGLVSRRTNPDDRRRTMVELTSRGRRELRRADQVASRVEGEVFERLTPEERHELVAGLRTAVAASGEPLATAGSSSRRRPGRTAAQP